MTEVAWTEVETARLVRLKTSNCSWPKIASLLNRPINSAQSKWKRLVAEGKLGLPNPNETLARAIAEAIFRYANDNGLTDVEAINQLLYAGEVA